MILIIYHAQVCSPSNLITTIRWEMCPNREVDHAVHSILNTNKEELQILIYRLQFWPSRKWPQYLTCIDPTRNLVWHREVDKHPVPNTNKPNNCRILSKLKKPARINLWRRTSNHAKQQTLSFQITKMFLSNSHPPLDYNHQSFHCHISHHNYFILKTFLRLFLYRCIHRSAYSFLECLNKLRNRGQCIK